MKRYFQSSISAVALSAMVMAGVVATVSISASPAFSQGNSANSNSNGGNRDNSNRNNSNRGGRDNNNGRGSAASSLGALNAAHANANALANASENSRVGMIEIYKLAVGATAEASTAFDVAESALSAFVEVCGLEATDPLTESCQTLLNEATALAGDTIPEAFTHTTYLDLLNQAVSDAYDAKVDAKYLEDKALAAAANKVTNEAVIIALWELLDLPSD